MHLIGILSLGAVVGLFAALVMNIFMRTIARNWGKRGDMVRALGSYFGKEGQAAANLGTLIHGGAGLVFGVVYFAIIDAIGALTLPYALFLGIGFGFLHGLFMSYALMFYASERHPDEEYRKATMEEGVIHLLGHLLFGAIVGLLGGAFGMAFGG